ncbi:hypothetical protein LCGC14_0886680 [marine sediment metagenome]|uniref:MPN domain-containing protein n=1 Tax=marine sediment metagenome TaxID=412755 RepID=A0A0F9RJZ8_9ZZZZ
MDQHHKNIISEAIKILNNELTHYAVDSKPLDNPPAVRAFLRLKLEGKKAECFAVLFLDNQHKLIEYRELFQGTIDGASVHVRIIIQQALELNAAAVIFAHNHPSGVAKPSQADQQITNKLKTACNLMDIRVIDHLIIGANEITSFAEMGLI